MEAIINFLKDGIAVIFYGIIFIFGVLLYMECLKELLEKYLKRCLQRKIRC